MDDTQSIHRVISTRTEDIHKQTLTIIYGYANTHSKQVIEYIIQSNDELKIC